MWQNLHDIITDPLDFHVQNFLAYMSLQYSIARKFVGFIKFMDFSKLPQ